MAREMAPHWDRKWGGFDQNLGGDRPICARFDRTQSLLNKMLSGFGQVWSDVQSVEAPGQAQGGATEPTTTRSSCMRSGTTFKRMHCIRRKFDRPRFAALKAPHTRAFVRQCTHQGPNNPDDVMWTDEDWA